MNQKRTRALCRQAVASIGLFAVVAVVEPGSGHGASAQAATARTGAPGVPTDADLLHAGLSPEPLVPARATRPEENRELAAAIRTYEARKAAGATDDVEPLTAFLADHPDTAWRPALLVSLGTIYRRTGHLSKALDAWQAAWDGARELHGNGRAIGDSALAKLSQFEAYLGRKERLAPLLADTRDRPLHGSAAELVLESHKGLEDMLQRPERSFRCGPLALERILLSENAQPPTASFGALDAAESTPDGLSLASVAALSARAGMSYQMAFRTPGADVVTPAVMHWKVGHYAAIVQRPDARFQVEDATFGETIRITKQALDEEASGYFLVPPGPLPAGWRPVSEAEGQTVWGRGDTGTNKDNGATGPDGPPPPCGGCTTWNVELSVVGLQLHDAPVGYSPPVGPAVRFELYYSHRDVLQPQTFSYTNLGPKWTTTWLSYVVDSGNGSVDLYRRGGGDEPYTFENSATTSDPGPFSEAVLTEQQDASGNATGFTRQLKDGSVETFSLAQGTQYFMTSVADPQGNAVTVKYDSQTRITSLVDAIGQVTTIDYALASDPLKITKVTDPFGRSATFTYTADGTHLASITDVLGITSSYTYGFSSIGPDDAGVEAGDDGGDGGAPVDGDFVTTLVTPYGTTTFEAGDNDVTLNAQRTLTITDTLGRVSHYEFVQSPPGSNDSDPATPTGMSTTNTYLEWRNTYIFDPEQYASAMSSGMLDYTQGRLVHWLHTLDDSTSRVPESTKEPLENRVWYDYPGQSSSIYVGTSNTALHAGRVLDDGMTTQLWTYQYNSLGRVTQAIDPAGRTLTLTYAANGIDLLSVANTTGTANDVLETFTYNGQHEPLTRTGANGATTQFAYNAAGQLVKRTDASGDVTTYGYANGYLTSVQGPLGASNTLTYDAVGRLATATDAAGETVTFAYDAADRLTSASFPDGTSAKLAYTLLDLTGVTDRLGRTTTYAYDSEREKTQIKDPLGQTIALAYDGAGRLSSTTDANGHATQLVRDAQERVTSKKYADGSAYTFGYEQTTSRLLTVTDALGQIATRANNVDDSIASLTYSNAHATTAPVTFTYDPAYPRIVSMTDGVGTTSYTYNPVTPPAVGAGLVQSVTSPVAGATGITDTVSYTYDALDRVIGRTVDGSTETWAYDGLSRMTSDSNALDTFALAYADATPRISGVTSKSGPTSAMTYFGPKGDGHLQQATFTAGATQLSQLGYTYDAQADVTTFTQAYVGQKLEGTSGGTALPPLLQEPPVRPTPRGDPRGLALPLAVAAALLLAVAHAARRKNQGARGLVVVAGPALLALVVADCGGGHGTAPAAPGDGGSEAGTPTEQVTHYAFDPAGRLTSATVGTDVSTPSSPQYAYAYDPASNITSITANGPAQALTYTSTNGVASGTYDANGSPTALGGATYTWDAYNRLLSFTSSGNESDFSYDGSGRLVRIVDKQAGSTVSDRAYTWCGGRRCAEHDNTQSGSPVSKRYFDRGVVVGGTAYYYVKDALGSVRQLVDATGQVHAQYDYDPYGNQTKISGDVDSDVGYAGYFHHAPSGLEFALYRAYDPGQARWLNRDPIGAAGGINLYQYVRGNPVKWTDPLGLVVISVGIEWSGGIGPGGAIGGYGTYYDTDTGQSGSYVVGGAGASVGAGAEGYLEVGVYNSLSDFLGTGVELGGGFGDGVYVGGNLSFDLNGTFVGSAIDIGFGLGANGWELLSDTEDPSQCGGGPPPGGTTGGGTSGGGTSSGGAGASSGGGSSGGGSSSGGFGGGSGGGSSGGTGSSGGLGGGNGSGGVIAVQ